MVVVVVVVHLFLVSCFVCMCVCVCDALVAQVAAVAATPTNAARWHRTKAGMRAFAAALRDAIAKRGQ